MIATMLANPFETIEAPLIVADMLEEQGQDEVADHYRRMGNLLLQVRTPDTYLAELNRWTTSNGVMISMRKDNPRWYGAMLAASLGDGTRACNCKMAWKVSAKEMGAISRLAPAERVIPRSVRGQHTGPRSISTVWISTRGIPLNVTGLSKRDPRSGCQFFRLEGAGMSHYLPLERVGFLARRHPTATWEGHQYTDRLTLVEDGEVVAVSAESNAAKDHNYLSL